LKTERYLLSDLNSFNTQRSSLSCTYRNPLFVFLAFGDTFGDTYLEAEGIDEALKYAAWRFEEIDVPILTGVA
jgi:hypothetical protein